MSVKWRSGPFLAIFMGAAWTKRGFMITVLSVRGSCSPGDTIEMIWPGADSILLEVEALDAESRYQPAALEEARRRRIPLRLPIIVREPDDERLRLEPGHILSVPEDEPHWPDEMRGWLSFAPAGVLLAAQGSLSYDKLGALPPPDERTYHNLVKLVDETTI